MDTTRYEVSKRLHAEAGAARIAGNVVLADRLQTTADRMLNMAFAAENTARSAEVRAYQLNRLDPSADCDADDELTIS